MQRITEVERGEIALRGVWYHKSGVVLRIRDLNSSHIIRIDSSYLEVGKAYT